MPEKVTGKETIPCKPSDSLIDDFLKFLEVERNASPRTIVNYTHSLEKYKESSNDFEDWFSCTSDDFREYLVPEVEKALDVVNATPKSSH